MGREHTHKANRPGLGVRELSDTHCRRGVHQSRRRSQPLRHSTSGRGCSVRWSNGTQSGNMWMQLWRRKRHEIVLRTWWWESYHADEGVEYILISLWFVQIHFLITLSRFKFFLWIKSIYLWYSKSTKLHLWWIWKITVKQHKQTIINPILSGLNHTTKLGSFISVY